MLYVGSLTDGLPLPIAQKAIYVDVMPKLNYWTAEEWSKVTKEIILERLIGTYIFDDKFKATILDLKTKLSVDTGMDLAVENRARFFEYPSGSRIKADDSSTLHR